MRRLVIAFELIMIVGISAISYFEFRMSIDSANGELVTGYVFAAIAFAAVFFTLKWVASMSRRDIGEKEQLLYVPWYSSDSISYWSWYDFILPAFLIIVIVTSGFVDLSIALYRSGIGTIAGGHIRGTELVDVTYNSYLWHLANAVPLLNIPDTLHWSIGRTYNGHIQGALVLCYTLFCIVPILYLGKKSLNTWRDRTGDSAVGQVPPTEPPDASTSTGS